MLVLIFYDISGSVCILLVRMLNMHSLAQFSMDYLSYSPMPILVLFRNFLFNLGYYIIDHLTSIQDCPLSFATWFLHVNNCNCIQIYNCPTEWKIFYDERHLIVIIATYWISLIWESLCFVFFITGLVVGATPCEWKY